ncbi:DUF624 domain-containing protein [Enterococcus sp. HY326]|uniref:DUF624 domain-containing protein n=1 Tax=Enterococcus sp. HY326 TaxID=2971265 RepID=UPI0022404561|nr:DUF624 domain-containing protein [Enterococcus sp. HY326]
MITFNPNSQFFKITTTAAQFICLNVIYILSCLPIITIGIATTALYDVTLDFADHESGYLIKNYFRSFKTNFKTALKLFPFYLIPLVALTFSAFFWFSFETTLGTVIGMLAGLVSLFLFLAFLISCGLTAKYQTSTKQTLQNSLLLVMAHPMKSLGILLIPLTMFLLAFIIPGFSYFILFLGFSFSAYCGAFLLLSIFANHR